MGGLAVESRGGFRFDPNDGGRPLAQFARRHADLGEIQYRDRARIWTRDGKLNCRLEAYLSTSRQARGHAPNRSKPKCDEAQGTTGA
jgi:hypothetical protein